MILVGNAVTTDSANSANIPIVRWVSPALAVLLLFIGVGLLL
jgi:hypothetical protein